MLYKEREKLPQAHEEFLQPQSLKQFLKPIAEQQPQSNILWAAPANQGTSSATVSFVIRTLNEAKMLGLVLDALQAQNIPPSEIILVDSGSTDGTTEIAAEHGATIICTAPEAFSYGRALNIGFQASQSEYVVALSGHAVPANPNWLQKLLHNFHNPSIAAVASRLVPYPNTALHNHWLSLPFYLRRTHQKNALWLFWNTATAYRRDVWAQLPFDEQMPGCEDREWAIRAIAAGHDVAYEPSAVVWHSHDESYAKFFQRVAFTTKMSHKYQNRLPTR